jgi:hypothetical protein
VPDKRVLVVYYSFTQQTRTLLRKFTQGLESSGVAVTLERLEPLRPYAMPFQSNLRLLRAMIATFFQRRMSIKPVSDACRGEFDRVVLAGPTWSYNPSGPVLDFLDRFGLAVCGGKTVIPFISCRAYWGFHHWVLKRKLRACGAALAEPVVFTHPAGEPWRSIGLLFKLRGRQWRKKHSWLRRRYPEYGHDAAQARRALEEGRSLAERIKAGG